MQISDETLMAFADGELSTEEARDIAQLVAVSPELSRRVEGFKASRDLLRAYSAKAGIANPEQDAALAKLIRNAVAQTHADQPDGASAFFTDRAKTPSPPANLNYRPWLQVAAAAALVLVGGWWFASKSAGLDPAELRALASLPSGESLEAPGIGLVTVIASYESGNGEFCREYETRNGRALTNAVACRSGQGWTQRIAVQSEIDPEGFQAASGNFEAMDNFIDRQGMGAPLSPNEEMALLTQ